MTVLQNVRGVVGNMLQLPFKGGKVGNVSILNAPAEVIAGQAQALSGELAHAMQPGSQLTVTTLTPGALQELAMWLENQGFYNIVIRGNQLTALR